MSRIAPSTWELSGASACLSFVALCLLAMAASFWVADRYQVFGVFARFLPFLTHPHIGVASCVLFRLTEASKLADMCLTLCCIQVLRFLASLRKLYITCERCLSTYLLLGCCPRVRRGSRKTALGVLYNWVREWQRRLAEVKRPPLLPSWWSLLSIAMLL